MAAINRHFNPARRGDLIRHKHMQTLNDAARISLRAGDTAPHILNVLGNFQRSVPDQPIEFGVLDEDLAAGSHATMSVYRYTPSGWADSNENIEVYDESGHFLAFQGDFVTAVWRNRHYVIVPHNAHYRIRFCIVSATTVSSVVTSVVGQVRATVCGVSKVPEEDASGNVTIYDGLGCVFTETATALIGRQGYAVYVHNRDYGGDACGTTTLPGTGSGDASAWTCRWEVDQLCCP